MSCDKKTLRELEKGLSMPELSNNDLQRQICKLIEKDATASDVEAIVMCNVEGIEMPVKLTINGKEMHFCIWPMSKNNWNCGYIAEDGSESFSNRNEFFSYKTMKAAAKACKNAIVREGYYT